MLNTDALLAIISNFNKDNDRGNLSLALYRWLFLKVKHDNDRELNLNIVARLNALRQHLSVCWVKHNDNTYELAVDINNQLIKLSRPVNKVWFDRYVFPTDNIVNTVELTQPLTGGI